VNTFVCEYCGSVCENEQVVALQNQKKIKQEYAPLSFLKLGVKGNFLGREYQVVGRIRYESADEEDTWFWDEWFLMSPTGYPLWIQEDENGFTLLRRYIPDEFYEFSASVNVIRLKNKTFELVESGWAKAIFLEGEFTWKAKPGEMTTYFDYIRNNETLTVEISENEIQLFSGKKLDIADLKTAFPNDSIEYSEEKTKKITKKANYRFIAILFFIFGFLGVFILTYTKSIGVTVFNDDVKIYVSQSENEYEYKDLSGKTKTFKLDHDSIVRFNFSSSSVAYPLNIRSYTEKEAGWWCVLNLYRKQKDNFVLSASVPADFWKAEGYDEGYWSEEKYNDEKEIKMKKGEYKLVLEYGSNLKYGILPSYITLKLKIKKDVWFTDPYLPVLIAYFILGIIFLIVSFAKKKKRSLSEQIDDYLNNRKSYKDLDEEEEDLLSWFLSRKK